MITKTVRLLAVLIVVGLCLYVVTSNNNVTTVALTPGWTVTANTGVIMISVFIFGILCAAIVATYFGFKAALRERVLRKRDRVRSEVLETIGKARGCLAAAEYSQAGAIWERILRQDPSSALAKMELARTLRAAGQTREALRQIESIRALDPANIEALFEAASINIELNNKTAALDNLALILSHHPNRLAAQQALQLSAELERFEDAQQYCRLAAELGADEAVLKEQRVNLEYQLLLRSLPANTPEEVTRLAGELRSFVKSRPSCIAALSKLAELELKRGEVLQAADILQRAVQAGAPIGRVSEISAILINANQPDQAVTRVKAALRPLTGSTRIDGELELARICLQIGMIESAKEALAGIPALAPIGGITKAQQHRLLTLQALTAAKISGNQELIEVLWKVIAEA